IFDLIFVVGLARHDDGESQRRIAGTRVAPFGNRSAFRADVEVPLRLAAHHDQIEAFVRLLVHEPVGRDRRPEHVRAHAPAQQRHWILLDVQQRAVVVGPGDVGLGVLDHVAEQLAAGDVLEADAELAPADGIFRVREQLVVRARFVSAELKERLADGERVAVEQYGFGRARLVRPANDQLILLAADEATRIPIAAVAHRHARVVFLDATDDLAIQNIDQRLSGPQDCVRISGLGAQMRQDLWVAARVVAEPVESVLADAERRRNPVRERGGLRGTGDAGIRYRGWHGPYIARTGLTVNPHPPAVPGQGFSVSLLGS